MVNYIIKKSNIEGNGIFTTNKIIKNTEIDIGIDFKLYFIPIITSHFGSWINHSYHPNTYLKYTNGKYYVVANTNIPKNTEITLNYNNTPWYIENARSYYI